MWIYKLQKIQNIGVRKMTDLNMNMNMNVNMKFRDRVLFGLYMLRLWIYKENNPDKTLTEILKEMY